MSTEKLYYADSHMRRFSARVTDCREAERGFRISLERTAFFPEGGGQAADTGSIGPAAVWDVHERDGDIWHYTDAALSVGEEYPCELDWEKRLRRMHHHSGEHIVSGITHSLYGLDNVGFHMGESFVTIDFNGELSWEQLTEIERRANRAVRENLPVRTYFPSSAALPALTYRSKLDLRENVRIVEIEGVDRCACCAPHVERTGEIGCIKLLDSMRHRGGVRLTLCCGEDALEYFRTVQQNVTEISALLSAKREETAAAVERVLREQQWLKERVAALGLELVRARAAEHAYTQGNVCVFDNDLDDVALRELANALAEKCSGIAAVFSGSDGGGYKYIICSRHTDLRKMAKEINAGVQGRGGGSAEMLRGSAANTSEMIQKFVQTCPV